MSVYIEDIETAIGDDELFEGDYNPCEDDPPDLTGITFQFTAVPKSGVGATITKACTVVGTKIRFPLSPADKAGRLGEIFTAKLRRVDAGFAHRWAEFSLKIVA